MNMEKQSERYLMLNNTTIKGYPERRDEKKHDIRKISALNISVQSKDLFTTSTRTRETAILGAFWKYTSSQYQSVSRDRFDEVGTTFKPGLDLFQGQQILQLQVLH